MLSFSNRGERDALAWFVFCGLVEVFGDEAFEMSSPNQSFEAGSGRLSSNTKPQELQTISPLESSTERSRLPHSGHVPDFTSLEIDMRLGVPLARRVEKSSPAKFPIIFPIPPIKASLET